MGTYVAGQCTFFISVTDAFCLGETHDKRVIKVPVGSIYQLLRGCTDRKFNFFLCFGRLLTWLVIKSLN